MSVYFIAQIKIIDDRTYAGYLAECDEIFSRFNGRYLAVDSSPEVIEGEWKGGRIVIIEFPERKDFDRWYHSEAYQRILQYRLAGAVCKSVLVNSNNLE